VIEPRTLFAKLLLLFLGFGALMTGVFIFVMRVIWRPRGRCSIGAQKARQLATQGMYARMRHPQYTGFILIMLGFLLQWPTLLTLVMFPVLVTMYVRLAIFEERQAEKEFSQVWRDYAAHTPRFLPRFGGSRHEPATPGRA
jgi:protein-S-isoprenylcysteine O-methyltransferase Ste14